MEKVGAMPKGNISSEERERLMQDKNKKYREDLARQVEEAKGKKAMAKAEKER